MLMRDFNVSNIDGHPEAGGSCSTQGMDLVGIGICAFITAVLTTVISVVEPGEIKTNLCICLSSLGDNIVDILTLRPNQFSPVATVLEKVHGRAPQYCPKWTEHEPWHLQAFHP